MVVSARCSRHHTDPKQPYACKHIPPPVTLPTLPPSPYRAGSTSALTQARTEVAALRHQLDVVKAEALSGFEEMRKGLREAARSTGQLADISGKLAKARKDNRELHNQVQDLKGQVRVFCRVRPVGTTGDPSEAVVDADAEESEVVLSVPGVSGASRAFAFDRVFGPGASQADVFNEVQPLVRSVMDGYNVCIFAYGQTGSGKTHTMTGPSGARRAEGERGVNWRALDELFRLREERVVEGWQVEIEVQSLEIYNDQVRANRTSPVTHSPLLDYLGRSRER